MSKRDKAKTARQSARVESKQRGVAGWDWLAALSGRWHQVMTAVALVLNHPGSTVGELVCQTDAIEQGPLALQSSRLALLTELHRAARYGLLERGPMRECRVRSVPTLTWVPTDRVAPRSLPVTGLRFLETLVSRAIDKLRADAA